MDDTEDDDEWYPYTEDPEFRAELANYPPQKALTTCNNRYFVKVSPTSIFVLILALRDYSKNLREAI